MNSKEQEAAVATLVAFSDAFNRHDPDAIMRFMTTDCVFVTAMARSGLAERVEGHDAVRQAFGAIWQAMPDAQWSNGRFTVCGERGFSEWTFSGTSQDGTRIEVDGCDLFTFRDGKIAVKDAFRKQNAISCAKT